jgi:hypothetical protein
MEKENKFTPGPWYVEETNPEEYDINTGDGGENIAFVSIEPQARAANALLIAAAPELLEALQGLLPMWESGIEEPWVKKARAAIKKAIGE